MPANSWRLNGIGNERIRSNSSEARLLAECGHDIDNEDSLREEVGPSLTQCPKYTCLWRHGLGLHLALILFYTSVAIWALPQNPFHHSHDATLTYSPARHNVKYEVVDFDGNALPQTSTSGKPSPELDQAWHNLLRYSNIRITEEELDLMDSWRKIQAVALPDGGYLAELMVYHELHCLKRIHQYMYPEYYFPNITQSEQEDNRLHNEHCIDIIRQGIMCRGDIALITMRWGHGKLPLANFSSSHECTSWKSLEEWSRGRSVNHIFELGYLKHPQHGDVFSDEFENKIGVTHESR